MKKILTFFMAVVVATSMFALPQANLSAQKAQAGFEKANVETPHKAKLEKKHRVQAMAHDFARPETTKSAAKLAPAKHVVAEGQTINMPMYFSVGPEYYEEYGDWYITLENDDWWMLKLDWYAPQGENNDGYVGTFTLDDFDLSNTYFLDPDYEYVDVEDITLEITKVKLDDVTARIELKATVLGSDGNTYVVTAEKEVVEAKETIAIEIKDANYAWNADDAQGVLTAKNDKLELSLTIEAWWATGPFSQNEVQASSVKYDGTEVEIASLDMLISTGKNAEGQVGYIITMDLISTDAIMYSVSLFAPLVATETVEIAINNLEIDESGAFDYGWIFLNGSNDEWDINAGIYGPWTMEEGTFSGLDYVMLYLTNKNTGLFTEQLYADLVVTNDPQYGWVVTIESFCTDNKVYHVTMKKDLASATDTVLIRYENSAIAQYYPHLKHDLLLANSNDLYYVGIDIVNVAMGESFTKANLDLEYSGIITNYGDKANQKWVDMADVQGKVYQVGDTTIIEALILSFDNVLYDVQLWYCVPTPTETVQVEIEATFDNNIQMEGYYKISGYNKENTLHVSLAPITEEVEGTFVNDGKFSSFGEGQYDFYYNETAVYKNVGGKAVAYSVEKCTMNVTVAENGDMTVVATIIASDAVQYEVTMTSKYNEYLDYDATEGAIDRTFDAESPVLIEAYEDDNAVYMELYGTDGSDLCALYFIVEEFDEEITIPAGTYPINKTLDATTVMASVGAVDNSPYPSFYAKMNAQGQLIAPLYFLVGGTVTVEKVDGKMKMEVNAVNSYGVPVHLVYDTTEPEGPVEMVGVVKRALQNGDATIVLTHEADGTAHIYNVVEGLAYEVSQKGVIAVDPENAGDFLAISDIAATEDGKLVAINYMQTQSGDDYVNEGLKRGETRVYLWNDLAGDPTLLFTSKMSSNWFRSKQGLTMAVKGTADNMEIFTTGIHATSAWARVSSYRVINGVYEEPAVNHNDHYYFYDIADAIALETTVGTQYELNASPLGAMNWVLDAELINPTEITEPETNNVEIATAVALTEDLGKKYNGASYVTVGEQHLMVAPYANAEGLLAGVKVLDITAGLDAATEVAVANLAAAVEATAAATAVAVNENVLTITLVADATLHTLVAELPVTTSGTTLTATGLETKLEGDGSYTLQGLAVVNGDETNLMDFMLCVYPTEGYTDAFLNNWSVMIFGAPTPGAFVENEDGTFTYTAKIEDTYGDGTVYNINMSGTIKKTEGPDYMELDDQITNLTIDLENMLLIGGPSENFEIEVVLGLGEDNFDGTFTLSSESSVSIRGTDAEFVEGYVYDIDLSAPSATAVVKVNWDGMYYAFTLTMTAAPAEATKVVVENATVEVEKYLLFGDTYDYSLKMTGNWTNEADGITYPVSVEVPVYYPEATEPFSILSTVTVGGMGDNDPWLGFGEGELTVTTVDGVVTVTGVVSDWSGLVIDITISGKLPQDPGPGTGIEDVEVEVKAVKVIKNGQLIISKDGKEYNAQGATVK